MTDGPDAVARGARITRLGSDFRWPGGRHVAVVFNVAFEAWSDGKAPGVGPMGNPLPGGTFDTNALSWGHYGAVRGIERLLRALDRVKLRGSVMVSGVLAERAPQTVKAIVSAGHEIVAHAYAQDIVPAALAPAPTSPGRRSSWRPPPACGRRAGSARAAPRGATARAIWPRPATNGRATCSTTTGPISSPSRPAGSWRSP
jgi:Polysaccharide deacetylase